MSPRRSRRSAICRTPWIPPPRGLHASGCSHDFSQQNLEALAYPSTDGFCYAVRHRLRLDSPPSPRGPLMVELFTAGCFGRSPGMVIARSSTSLRTSSPRRHGLNEVGDSEPPATDYTTTEPRLGCRFTTSSMTARVRDLRTRVCPGRPRSIFGREPPSDRSCGLFSVPSFTRAEEVYSQQPPSNRTSVSPRIRLYASPTATYCGRGDESRSLRPAGEAGLLGVGV